VTRWLSNSQQSLGERELLAFRQLVDIGVTSGTLYACTGKQYLFARGNTYTPVAGLGGIEPIKEESDPFPREIRLWMRAVNSSDLYEPMREDMFNRPVRVYETLLNPDTLTVAHTPELRWQGYVNEVEVRFGDEERGNYYEIGAISDMGREPVLAYSNKETLTLEHSGDTFCDYQHLVPSVKAMWGQQPTQHLGSKQIATPANIANDIADRLLNRQP
jgi:hypothetical protein